MTVNPNDRADIHKICSHQWLNEGYSDEQQCLRIAEEMASSTTVRLDLLLSLAPAPTESSNNLAVQSSQNNAENEVRSDSGPLRSQSLGSISPSRAAAVIPDSPGKHNLVKCENLNIVLMNNKKKILIFLVEKKPKKLKKRDRSMSRSKKSSQSDTGENDLEAPTSKESVHINNSKKDLPQSPLQSTTNVEPEIGKTFDRARRRSSRVLDAVEKLDQIESMAKSSTDKKRRGSLGSGSSNSSRKSIDSEGSTAQDPIKEPQFSLESTVGLNKLAESALSNKPICANKNDFKNLPDDLRKSLNAIRVNIYIF